MPKHINFTNHLQNNLSNEPNYTTLFPLWILLTLLPISDWIVFHSHAYFLYIVTYVLAYWGSFLSCCLYILECAYLLCKLYIAYRNRATSEFAQYTNKSLLGESCYRKNIKCSYPENC